MSNFITFGCWNKWYCNPGPELSNPLSIVIAKMDDFITKLKDPPAFVCIAGDNYYPDIRTEPPLEGEEKGKKTKTLSVPELQSGFECLSEFQKRHRSIPIDIIAGNHDIEGTKKMTVIPASVPVTEPCIITKSEIESTMHRRKMNFTMFNYRVINNTLVIMLDSNIYCESLGSDELQCYALLVEHTLSKLQLPQLHDGTPITNVSQLKAIQLAWLENMYDVIRRDKTEFKNVMIVAHHPLALYKIKEDKSRYEIVKPDYLGFCYSIYHYLKTLYGAVHLFYSCADLHTYQSGIVTINFGGAPITINQEIAGTGGTELEGKNADFECAAKYEHDDERKRTSASLVKYRMTKIDHNHGFLHWSHNKTGMLSAMFVPVDGSSESGSASGSSGGTKRRRQRASKRRRQRTFKRGRRMRRSRSRSRH
jgi:hypothetical protein